LVILGVAVSIEISETVEQVSASLAPQIATFRVGPLLFGIDVSLVQEVIRSQRMTKVPLAPPTVKGLINLRGQILTAIDLREVLGIEPRPEDQPPMNVVVQIGTDVISMLVDKIEDVLDIDSTRLEEIPETIETRYKNLLTAVYKLEKGLLLVLQAEKIIEFGEEI
jgi:purine-binding chemotaxis protein CheW